MFRTICLGPNEELERTWISSIPPLTVGHDLERSHTIETQEELLDPTKAPRVQAHHVPSFLIPGCHLTSLPPMEG